MNGDKGEMDLPYCCVYKTERVEESWFGQSANSWKTNIWVRDRLQGRKRLRLVKIRWLTGRNGEESGRKEHLEDETGVDNLYAEERNFRSRSGNEREKFIKWWREIGILICWTVVRLWRMGLFRSLLAPFIAHIFRLELLHNAPITTNTLGLSASLPGSEHEHGPTAKSRAMCTGMKSFRSKASLRRTCPVSVHQSIASSLSKTSPYPSWLPHFGP